MREIIFRGVAIKDSLAVSPNYTKGTLLYGGYYSEGDNHFIVANFNVFEVEPGSVQQAIGLKDKNNESIYEGDILKTKHGNGQVAWNEEYLQYFILFGNEKGSESLDIGWSKDIEVVGNIYEHSQLKEEDTLQDIQVEVVSLNTAQRLKRRGWKLGQTAIRYSKEARCTVYHKVPKEEDVSFGCDAPNYSELKAMCNAVGLVGFEDMPIEHLAERLMEYNSRHKIKLSDYEFHI